MLAEECKLIGAEYEDTLFIICVREEEYIVCVCSAARNVFDLVKVIVAVYLGVGLEFKRIACISCCNIELDCACACLCVVNGHEAEFSG